MAKQHCIAMCVLLQEQVSFSTPDLVAKGAVDWCENQCIRSLVFVRKRSRHSLRVEGKPLGL